MDKETLSNYGWIVIAVLVLVVMIALATPFGSFVSEAVQSTTKGLFDVNKNALNAAGVPGLTVQDQEFDVPDMNHGAGNQEATSEAGLYKPDGTFVSWDKLVEDGTIKVINGVLTTYASGDDMDGYTNDSSDALSGNLVISNTVTSLGEQALCACINLTSVKIPDSVTNIGNEAFLDCASLTSVTIPNGVTTIGRSAFSYSGLTSITIPGSVNNIGDYAVYSCDNLLTATIMEGVTSLGKSMFFNCPSLTTVNLPESLTTISETAFMSCNSLASITIPANVTSIGKSAFYHGTGATPHLVSVTFKNTDGWSANGTALNASDLANQSTAATYLETTYRASNWTRS